MAGCETVLRKTIFKRGVKRGKTNFLSIIKYKSFFKSQHFSDRVNYVDF